MKGEERKGEEEKETLLFASGNSLISIMRDMSPLTFANT